MLALVESAVIGIRATREREEVCQKLKRDKEDKGREPLFNGGNGKPVIRSLVSGVFRLRCGNVQRHAMRSGFARRADDHARALISRAAGEEGDERRAFVDFGEWPVAKLLGLLAFGGRKAGLFDF